jgi:uncharacterized membrane protein
MLFVLYLFCASLFNFSKEFIYNVVCCILLLLTHEPIERRVCRYQRGNQKPYIEEEQTTQ